MTSFRKALMITAIPSTTLAIAAIAIARLNADFSSSPASRVHVGLGTVMEICLITSVGIAGAALLSSIVFVLMNKSEIAKGTGIGGGIGLIVFVIAFIVGLSIYG